jgi:hypothetical protein
MWGSVKRAVPIATRTPRRSRSGADGAKRGHDRVLALLDRVPVEPDRVRDGPEAARLRDQPVHATRGDQGPLGHAAAVDAEPTQRAAVGQRHPGAEGGRGPRRGEAGGAGTDHHEIEALHGGLRLRP